MTAQRLADAFDRKRLATAQARAALAGVTVALIEGDNGGPELIASRWALTKRFSDLAELETWLDRVTGEAAR